MPWVNLLTQYPDAEIAVYDQDGLIEPADYESGGISITSTDGRVTLTAPDIGGGGGNYKVVVRPQGSGANLHERARLLNVSMEVAEDTAPSASAAELSKHAGGQDIWTGVAGADVVAFAAVDPWEELAVSMERAGS